MGLEKYRKYLFINLPPEDFSMDKITEDELKKMYNVYKRKGILYEPLSAVFLYAITVSPFTKSKILNYEQKRLKNKMTISRTFGVSLAKTDDVIFQIVENVLDKFDVTHTTVKELQQFIIPFYEIISLGIEPQDFISVEKGIVVLPLHDAYKLSILIHTNYVNHLLESYRGEILKRFGTKEVRKFVNEVLKATTYEVKKFPPCVEHILNGDVPVGARNNSLFALINFFKYIRSAFNYPITDEEIEEFVWRANRKFPEPLRDREVRNLINYHLYKNADKVYNSCSIIRNEIPELCPYSDRKECWKNILKANKPTLKRKSGRKNKKPKKSSDKRR